MSTFLLHFVKIIYIQKRRLPASSYLENREPAPVSMNAHLKNVLDISTIP